MPVSSENLVTVILPGADNSALPADHSVRPASTAPDSSAPAISHARSGTLIDPNFRALDGSHDLVSVEHRTEMHGIDSLLHRNQLDGTLPPVVPGFKLLHHLGDGAYGTVWEAQSVAFEDEHVAIKFFKSSHWEPMHREISRIARLEGCAGVMPFKQYADKKANPPYYVMPFASHGSLGGLMKKRGPLPVKDALALFGRIVDTMAFVHAKCVIHCDLKPANILLNESDQPLVADFGQAQLGSQEPGSYGTLFYMPPEQAALQKSLPDTNWDVYALGAILFEMLTGKTPRSSEETSKNLAAAKDMRSRLEVYVRELKAMPKVCLRKVVKERVPANLKDVDPRLAAIVESCLAIDPKKRPRSAGQLRERLLEREAWKRQRSMFLVAASVTIAFFAVMTAFGIWSAQRVFSKHSVQHNQALDRSLERTAAIAGQLVEENLRDRVQAATKLADDAKRESPLMAELEDLRGEFRQHPGKADEIPADIRMKYGKWLQDEGSRRFSWWFDHDNTCRAIGLMVLVDDQCYLLATLDHEGNIDAPSDDPAWHNRFRMNWAWRDYYAGQGNHFEEKGRSDLIGVRREPIKQPHISHVYRTMAKGNPLRIDVAAPIANEDGETVAIIITGIDLHQDLLRWINHTGEEKDQQEILIVNDRGCWTAHPDPNVERRLEFEDPQPVYESFTQLIKTTKRPEADPMMNGAVYRTVGVPIYPYSAPVNKDNEELYNKKWCVVTRMSENDIEAPLSEMRSSIYGVGWSLLMVSGIVVLSLWIWWLRTLRRQELLAHG